MKYVGQFFGEAAVVLALLAIGLGAVFLVKWGWGESPLITVVSVVVALGFMVFGVVASTGKKDFGTVGVIAGSTAVLAAAAAVVVVQYGGPLISS
jgi:hypothetical protein